VEILRGISEPVAGPVGEKRIEEIH